MNNLTNQELIQELQNRIETGNIEVQVNANETETHSYSLLSKLGSKEKLLLIGLSVVFTLLICSLLKVTTTSPAGLSVELQENKNPTTEI
jgi:hypothetical protein